MSTQPISDLRRRMIEDMSIRNFGEKAQTDYIRHVERFVKFLLAGNGDGRGSAPLSGSSEDKQRAATNHGLGALHGGWTTRAMHVAKLTGQFQDPTTRA